MPIESTPLRKGLQQLCTLQPFWGTLALHMEFVQDDSQPTLCTDGKRIRYNKPFCDSLSVGFCTFVLAHEVSHPFLQHLTRPFKINPHDTRTWGQTKDGKTWHYHPEVWNVAGDYVINLMLQDAGFQLWPKSLISEAYRDKTTEQVYNEICPDNPPPPPMTLTLAGEGDGQGDGEQEGGGSGQQAEPNGGGGYDSLPEGDPIIGQDIDPSSGPAEDFSQQEFTEIVQKAAAIAKAQGKLPGTVAGMIKEATEPQYPVYMLLENFIDTSIRDDDMSWKRPHRNFMNAGIILPSAHSDKVSHVVLVYDTSGSVPDEDLARFHRVGGDIIRRLKPAKLTVIQCDASVSDVTEVERDTDWPKEIKCKGRGGTSFVPPFEHLKKHNTIPSCLVYLTDMYGDFPSEPPLYPTLWISTEKDMNTAPFGQVIYFNG